jgi:hypothetical protein
LLALVFHERAGRKIERTISEKMAMLMVFPAPEGDVFIVDGLCSFLILILKG